MVDKVLKGLDVESKANVYFDGKVTSRSFYREDGVRFTIGVVTPGTYTFPVGPKEEVQLIAGTAEILLPTEKEWRTVSAPDAYTIIANSEFQIRCYETVEYLCDYIVE
ncbi:MAG: pyrimidine/purine nucleoside phosphorylase [Clostridiales Family XIII bacterium]|jgi:uncharacterized protein YaiE (UPF0345 family)|nr:pyrimidine/purine nucleoside phosphorylase [Clostridiales Family XIII bacterium]